VAARNFNLATKTTCSFWAWRRQTWWRKLRRSVLPSSTVYNGAITPRACCFFFSPVLFSSLVAVLDDSQVPRCARARFDLSKKSLPVNKCVWGVVGCWSNRGAHLLTCARIQASVGFAPSFSQKGLGSTRRDNYSLVPLLTPGVKASQVMAGRNVNSGAGQKVEERRGKGKIRKEREYQRSLNGQMSYARARAAFWLVAFASPTLKD
jgi:hypothetical protein